MAKSCDIGLSTVLLKREILGSNKFPNLKTKEDFVLWLKYLKKSYKIFGINTDLTSWRKLDNSLSSSTLQKLSDGFSVYHNYMKFSFIKSVYYREHTQSGNQAIGSGWRDWGKEEAVESAIGARRIRHHLRSGMCSLTTFQGLFFRCV